MDHDHDIGLPQQGHHSKKPQMTEILVEPGANSGSKCCNTFGGHGNPKLSELSLLSVLRFLGFGARRRILG